MEEESFENTEISDILNESFISIKVDREERADIDSVYMSVCTLLTGSGGWPLTILMTPDKKPFFAGTYFPPRNSYGRMGLYELLNKIIELWEHDKPSLLNSCTEIYEYLKNQEKAPHILSPPNKSITDKAYHQFEKMYDKTYGGFSNAPKFPMPHNILFLIRYGVCENNKQAIEMACETLTKMYQGGIYDHIGGGFSRYSTDEKWLVPHFEKMLYDNALLVLAYSEGYAVSKNKLFEKVVRETIAYMLTELKSTNCGFYCSQDADSDGEEGRYYTFTTEEIIDVLGEESGRHFIKTYNITSEGCYEGKSIANLITNPRYYVGTYAENKDFKLNETHYEDEDIKRSKRILYEYRKQRTTLHRDEKQLTSWNAMAIAALAKASYIFDDSTYLKVAEKAQEFIDRCLTMEGSRLFVSYKDGAVSNKGLLEDYAFYAWSLIELYEATFDTAYLEKASVISERMLEYFWDVDKSGFFLYSNDSEQLLTRPKETYDGALPSGNSVAAYVLSRLYKITSNIKWKSYLDRQLSFICGQAAHQPATQSFALLSLLDMLNPSIDIVCTCNDENKVLHFMKLLKSLLPFGLNSIVKTDENKGMLGKISPHTEDYVINQKNNLYYICKNGTCMKPMISEKDVLEYVKGCI